MNHDEVLPIIEKIIREISNEDGEHLPNGLGKSLAQLLTMVLTICTDMIRITCVVHERVEEYPKIAHQIVSKKLIDFITPFGMELITEHPKVLHKVVIWTRDETEQLLGVKK